MLRDRKVRISILLPPLIQLVIFTFAATLDVKNVPIGILNRDAGEQGFLLVERFYGTKIFNNNIIFLSVVIKPLYALFCVIKDEISETSCFTLY